TMSEYEESMLLELFGNIANEYVKPFKDFIREVERNKSLGRQTTSDWLDFVTPSVKLLAGASEKMGYEKIHSIMGRLERAIEQERAGGSDALPQLFCDRILVEHHRLASLLPATFALALSDDELAAKK